MLTRLFSRAAPATPTPEEPAASAPRSYTVGWLFTNDKSSVIWETPKPIRQEPSPSDAAKSVAYCPAVIEFDRRHFVIPCPIDLHMRLAITADEIGRAHV